MGRAQGKHHGQRKPETVEIDPESPEGRQLGMSPRTQGVPSAIPGGRLHIQNAQTVRQQVPIADAKPEVRDLNAHGVPPGSATTRERAELERGPNTVHHGDMPHLDGVRDEPRPIPVHVVQDGRARVYRGAYPHSFTVPGAGVADPVRLCGWDPRRQQLLILNEDSTNAVRIAQRPSDLSATVGDKHGALLPAGTNSYLKFDTQDEVFAIAPSGTAVTVSVIQVTERDL